MNSSFLFYYYFLLVRFFIPVSTTPIAKYPLCLSPLASGGALVYNGCAQISGSVLDSSNAHTHLGLGL